MHNNEAANLVELRRQNLDYSPSKIVTYTLSSANGIDRRRWYELIGRQCMPGNTRVFGVTLDELYIRERTSSCSYCVCDTSSCQCVIQTETAIPSVVKCCTEYLRQGDNLSVR